MAGGVVKIVSSGQKLRFRRGANVKPTPYKKVYRARYSKYKSSIPRRFISNQPFPPLKLYHLAYAGDHALTCNAFNGVLGSENVFRLNSMYDPDKTYAGHQPSGFDQLSPIYNRYKVVGATVTLNVNDPEEDGVGVAWMFTNPSNIAETLTGQNMDIQSERQQSGIIRINNSGSQSVTRTMRLSMATLAGITKLQFKADPDNYTGPMGSNPANEIALHIAAGNYRTTTSKSVFVHVKIVYHVLMYQRKILPTS